MELTLTKSQLYKYSVGAVILMVLVALGLVLMANPGFMKFGSKEIPYLESCLPTFRDGGGPYYKEGVEFREKIVPANNAGRRLIVEGYVFDTDCTTTIPNAVLDIWQANENGEYEEEYYRGKVTTDVDGFYTFETVMPKGYGEGTGYRPPHIHFKVHINGQEIVTSQMFFEDVLGEPGFNEEYIIDVDDSSETLRGVHHFALPAYYLE